MGHERPHRGVAHERFLPAGPFAVLPMTDLPGDPKHGHRSSIVWTEREELAPAMLALDDDAFSAELGRRFGPWYGDVKVLGGRWSYPLSLLHAERYAAPRLALVGDAAHAIHPIAGQGLNLGIRGVAALAEVVVEAARLGLDIGGPEVLARYERWRRFDATALVVVTDGLNKLFSNDISTLKLVRDLGLAAVNAVGPAKRFFMRHAMGVVGDLPRLMEGRAALGLDPRSSYGSRLNPCASSAARYWDQIASLAGAEAVEIGPGINPRIVQVVEGDADGVMADGFDLHDADMAAAGNDLFALAVALDLGRGALHPQQFRRQGKIGAVIEAHMQCLGLPLEPYLARPTLGAAGFCSWITHSVSSSWRASSSSMIGMPSRIGYANPAALLINSPALAS